MSWLDNVNNIEFLIKTGDGKTYSPKIKTSSKEKEYNVSKFEYINRSGSRVERKKPKSNLHAFEFFFQGPDHIDKVRDFETSADDNRSWVITHPVYGKLTGQPTNLKISDSHLNVTKINVDFWEVSFQKIPKILSSPKDAIIDKAKELEESLSSSFSENRVAEAKDIDITEQAVMSSISSITVYEPDRVKFEAKVRSFVSGVNDLVLEAVTVIDSIDAIYEQIVEFKFPIAFKIRQLTQSYFEMKNKTESLYNKILFEVGAGTIIKSMATTLVYPFDNSDYRSRTAVAEMSVSFLEVYEDYLESVEKNELSIYESALEPYSPDPTVQLVLQDLVNLVFENLFLIAFDSKQERTYITTTSTNLILMAHKLVGLDEDDVALEEFKEMNNISLKEIFEIKKGRELKYFV